MKATIPFSDFARLDLVVGTIKVAKAVKDSDKLVQLKVDVGEAGERSLVAGLAKTYKTSELVGKQIVVLNNLEQKEIRGVISEGMLLAADVEGEPVLITFEKEVPAGTRIR